MTNVFEIGVERHEHERKKPDMVDVIVDKLLEDHMAPMTENNGLTAKLEAANTAYTLVEQDCRNLTEKVIKNLNDRITEQAAQIEALEKDAARYRELCRHIIVPSPSLWDTGVGFAVPYIKARAGRISKEELDATLDTAIIEHKEGA